MVEPENPSLYNKITVKDSKGETYERVVSFVGMYSNIIHNLNALKSSERTKGKN